MTHRRIRTAAALSILALAGCATAASMRPDARLATFPRLRGPGGEARACGPAKAPRVLPAANTVVDSAALVARLASLGEGTAVYSLLFAPDGSVVRAARIQDATGGALDAAADAVLAESVRRQGAARERWGVQLRVTSGARRGLRVSRQEFCPVVATLVRRPAAGAATSQATLNRAEWTAGAANLPPGDGVMLPPSGPTPTAAEYVATPIRKARVTVTADGEVVNAGGDAAKLHQLSLHRLEPALIDRIPVDATIEW